MTTPSPVLKDWVIVLPWKMQSALLSSLRGVDGGPAPHLKQVQKFVRQAVQHDADPSTTYMAADLSWMDDRQARRDVQNELGRTSLHYAHHLIEGLTIISHFTDNHNDRITAALLVEHLLTNHVHWHVETAEEIKERLS